MRAAVPAQISQAWNFQVQLMHERATLQAGICALTSEMPMCNKTQLIVDKRHKRCDGAVIACLPPRQQLADLVSCFGHSPKPRGMQKASPKNNLSAVASQRTFIRGGVNSIV